MSSRSLVSVRSGVAGTSSLAIADCGNTFQRLGLERIYYLPDGTPQTGAVSITSTSGLDCGQLLAVVPEPETYAMLLAGLGLIAWRRKHTIEPVARGRPLRAKPSPVPTLHLER